MPSPIMKYFDFAHLPPKLQDVSGEIFAVACKMEALLPDGAEKSAGLRKLLEAKDCFVRAALDRPPHCGKRLSQDEYCTRPRAHEGDCLDNEKKPT